MKRVILELFFVSTIFFSLLFSASEVYSQSIDCQYFPGEGCGTLGNELDLWCTDLVSNGYADYLCQERCEASGIGGVCDGEACQDIDCATVPSLLSCIEDGNCLETGMQICCTGNWYNDTSCVYPSIRCGSSGSTCIPDGQCLSQSSACCSGNQYTDTSCVSTSIRCGSLTTTENCILSVSPSEGAGLDTFWVSWSGDCDEPIVDGGVYPQQYLLFLEGQPTASCPYTRIRQYDYSAWPPDESGPYRFPIVIDDIVTWDSCTDAEGGYHDCRGIACRTGPFDVYLRDTDINNTEELSNRASFTVTTDPPTIANCCLAEGETNICSAIATGTCIPTNAGDLTCPTDCPVVETVMCGMDEFQVCQHWYTGMYKCVSGQCLPCDGSETDRRVCGYEYDPTCNNECVTSHSDPTCTTSNGHEGIYTAIGCIPVENTQALTAFLLSWGLGIAGGIALLLIAYAGFLIMTSQGNPQRLQAGKELLTAALSGLLLIIFSATLLRLIGVEILKIPGFEQQQ